MIETLSTYLPPWGSQAHRLIGLDEDAVTLAVAAGLGALRHVDPSSVERLVLVSRNLPLLEGGNGAALLAGCGLPATVAVVEQVGGAPAALEAVASAAAGTLVIGADADPPGREGAGAGAAYLGQAGASLTRGSRVQRSLPVMARDAFGGVADYGDPRLARERGVRVSLHRAGLDAPADAVAGVRGRDLAGLGADDAEALPTTGASSPFFALASLAQRSAGGHIVAVEQASFAAADLATGAIVVARDEPAARALPARHMTGGAEIAISLAAYERAFEAKLRLEAARCRRCGTRSYPPRLRCTSCGSEEPTDAVALPREAEVYTCTTVHTPVPGLATPYSLVLVELGDSGVRVLVHLTDAQPGAAQIGQRGRLVFRRVALRSGVPDYGYGFAPSHQVEVAA
jgi:uncharacterized OB-fold protein